MEKAFRPLRVRKRPSAGGLQSTVADRPDVDGHGSVPSMWCSSQSVAHYLLYSVVLAAFTRRLADMQCGTSRAILCWVFSAVSFLHFQRPL